MRFKFLEFFSELDKKNGASMIAKILIEDCTELHMFVGTAANSAYQNPGMAFDHGNPPEPGQTAKRSSRRYGKESYGNVLLIRRINHGNE